MHELRKDTTVLELTNLLSRYQKEIGGGEKTTGSHSFPSSIGVRCDNSEDDFELVGVDVQQAVGCGCWTGVTFVIKRVEQDVTHQD